MEKVSSVGSGQTLVVVMLVSVTVEMEMDVSVIVMVSLARQVVEVDDVLDDDVVGDVVDSDVVVPEGQVLIVTVVVNGSHVVGAQVEVHPGRVDSRVLVENVDCLGDGQARDVSISGTGLHSSFDRSGCPPWAAVRTGKVPARRQMVVTRRDAILRMSLPMAA